MQQHTVFLLHAYLLGTHPSLPYKSHQDLTGYTIPLLWFYHVIDV